ncbi:MAG: hypothetical protein AAFW60_02585 [Pseudomonadota bacterium]
MNIRRMYPFYWLMIALAGCVSVPISEPKPVTDLSWNGTAFTLDLRKSAGVKVNVNGKELNLLLLPYSDTLLFLNQKVADQLSLKAIFFGLGVASFSDGDFSVQGKGFSAEYSVGEAPIEKIWALVMQENIFKGYDGAISIGAIPAERIRLLLNDARSIREPHVRRLTLSGKSRILESQRDYSALQFSKTLALYQDEVSANRKASFYIVNSNRAAWVGGEQELTRMFNNVRPHRKLLFNDHFTVDGFEISELLGETLGSPMRELGSSGENSPSKDPKIEDRVVVIHDDKSARNAPVLYLGRKFFEDCSEITLNKSDFLSDDQIVVSVTCDDYQH